MIHAVCLNWNGEQLLRKLIPGLKLNLGLLGGSSQVYLRDNGSTDLSVPYADEQGLIIEAVGHNNESFSGGVNSLVNLAKPDDDDLLLLINNDIEFKDECSLKKMYDLMENPEVGVVGARLLYENKKMSHNDVIFSRQYGNMPWHFREGKWPIAADKTNRYFQAVTAACCFVRASCFKNAGGLDETYRWAFEDISLNLDIGINQKKKIICCGGTEIIHATSKSLKKNPVNKKHLPNNVKHFKEKWFGKYEIDHDKYLKDKNYNLV